MFLICSDGLTSMISDDELASILRSADGLEEAAESLVRAANQSGGKDNITVVMFRLGNGDDGQPSVPREDETIAGQLQATEVSEAALDQATEPHPARRSPVEPRRRRRRDATIVAPPRAAAGGPRRRGAARRASRPSPRRCSRWPCSAGIGTGLYLLSRQVYFIGTNDAGLVTLYRGVPYELPFGIDLYEQKYASGVPARAIPSTRRKRVLDHEWRGRQDAEDLLRRSSEGSCRADVGAHPRAVRADPGVAAGGGRVRRRAGHAHARTSATPRSPTAPSSSACA